MPDTLTPEQRSRCMAAVKGKNTKPELIVRSLAHRLGYRFRIHRRDLPGSPDLVFPVRRRAVFVHGCFWHQHTGCPRSVRPATRPEFWNTKLDRNRERDARIRRELRRMGWTSLVIWECEVRNPEAVASKLTRFLERPPSAA